MEAQERDLYAFGAFRLDARERLLTCDGKPVPLAPKAFDVLLLLVQNAGSLMEKDVLLRQVWPDTFVEEGNLAKHVSLLRKALSERMNGAEYIETVPKRGYRFVAEVSKLANGRAMAPPLEGQPVGEKPAQHFREGEPSVRPRPEETQVPERRRWLRERLPIAGVFMITAMVILLSWVLSPAPAPKVLGTVQLTRTGRPRWNQDVLTDGLRLYLAEKIGGKLVLAWVPLDGGDPTIIPTPFANTLPLDISPDRTTLLLASFEGEEDEYPLWTMPVTSGSPERLGSLVAFDAAWLPDGRRILFSRGSELYVANEDGSEPRKVSSASGRASHFHWSPDGGVLRFTVEDTQTSAVSIWEAAPDGANARPWSSVRSQPKPGFLMGECCGVWTPDGKYFIYRSSQPDTVGLWALREHNGWHGLFKHRPFLLHTWPSFAAFFTSLVAPDGRRILFIGDQDSRELVRYDAGSKHFVPYLSAVPARRVDFSRNNE